MLVGEQKCIISLEDIKNFKLDIPSRMTELQESETFHLVVQQLAVDPANGLKFWLLYQKTWYKLKKFTNMLLFILFFPQDVQISNKQAEVDDMVSKIENLQAKYWSKMKKSILFVVDTSYLLARHKLPEHSSIIVPFQVLLELSNLKKKMQKRVKSVKKILQNKQNIFYQIAQTKKLYQTLFQIKNQDNDGYILATALFLKESFPFRKIVLLCKDKDLSSRFGKDSCIDNFACW